MSGAGLELPQFALRAYAQIAPEAAQGPPHGVDLVQAAGEAARDAFAIDLEVVLSVVLARDGAAARRTCERLVSVLADALTDALAVFAVVLASLAAAARPRVLRFAIGCASRNNVTPVSIPAGVLGFGVRQTIGIVRDQYTN